MPPTPRSYIVISEGLHCRRFCKLVLVVVGANQSVCIFCTEHDCIAFSLSFWLAISNFVLGVNFNPRYVYSLVMENHFGSSLIYKLNSNGHKTQP